MLPQTFLNVTNKGNKKWMKLTIDSLRLRTGLESQLEALQKKIFLLAPDNKDGFRLKFRIWKAYSYRLI